MKVGPSATSALDTLVRIVERNARERPQDVKDQARNVVKRLRRIGERLAEFRL